LAMGENMIHRCRIYRPRIVSPAWRPTGTSTRSPNDQKGSSARLRRIGYHAVQIKV
jgi:hypothetical protein